MSWQGKLLGGSLGSILGPWGAIAGAAAGHYFVDRKGQTPQKQAQRLLAITAAALSELASTDGRYNAAENTAIRVILTELNHALGNVLAPHELAYLVDASPRIDRALARLSDHVRDNANLAHATVTWLWRVAVSDGDETPPEVACISLYARHLPLSADALHAAAILYVRQSASTQERRDACALLGVPYHADEAQIKAAYRTLSQTYHPDKHVGLDPAIQALTAEKFAQIKAAYDIVRGRALGDWFTLAPSGRQLIPAAADADVLCFTCRRPVRLPPAEHIASARCPYCQTLLAFEREFAEHLMSIS